MRLYTSDLKRMIYFCVFFITYTDNPYLIEVFSFVGILCRIISFVKYTNPDYGEIKEFFKNIDLKKFDKINLENTAITDIRKDMNQKLISMDVSKDSKDFNQFVKEQMASAEKYSDMFIDILVI